MEPTNSLLVASTVPLGAGRLRAASRAMPSDLRRLASGAAGRLSGDLKGGDAFTDDRAPVEWLIDESIVRYAAGQRCGSAGWQTAKPPTAIHHSVCSILHLAWPAIERPEGLEMASLGE